MTEFPQLYSGLAVPVFTQGDDPIACLNKAMSFMSAVAASRFPLTNNQLKLHLIQETRPLFKTAGLLCNKFKGGKDKVMMVLAIRVMLLVLGETMQEGRQGLLNVILIKVKDTWLGNALSLRSQGMLHDSGIPYGQGVQTTIPNNAAFQTEDLDAYDSDCDDVSNAKAVLMANLSNYGFDVISEEKANQEKNNESLTAELESSVISSQHVVIPMIDDEETLILEEFEDFGKRFVPQQELFAEQAFWLQTSHPNTDQSDISPVKIEAPRELPKVSMVNTSLKKLKYHLGKFDTMVKKRITPDAITEGEWGFEHTKVVFLNEIIPFLKTIKDIFNVFDKDLLNEVMEVQTVFNQMEAAVQ
ncbi:hypothetical protein Tco_1422956 [Tanacetum coccineum]